MEFAVSYSLCFLWFEKLDFEILENMLGKMFVPNSFLMYSKEMPKHHREQHPKQQLQRAKCGIKFLSYEK